MRWIALVTAPMLVGATVTIAQAQPGVQAPPSLRPHVADLLRSESEESTEPRREESREEEPSEEEPIETDRDSFTPATTTANAGRLIVESAYSFVDNRDVKETHSYPELLLRYGLNDWLELRLGWNYEVGGAGNETSGAGFAEDELPAVGGLERESRIAYGLKASLTDQCVWVPQSAVVLQAFTPTSGEATDTQFVGTYVLGWELSHRWRLDGAVRYGTAEAGEDRFDVWAPSVVVKAPVCDRLNLHAEWFGIFSEGKADEFTRHFVSPGVHYLITPDLEIGVRVGWGLNDQSARFFSNVGLGWRF
jgi:hypothetical protein